jgi:peptidoglycan/LPS O-acetylase OafA/YrhL
MRTITHAEYLGMKRFPALDGIRALAAVMVVVFHFAGPAYARLNGWIGVHLFFVLSGYLITTLALREEARNGKISLRDFYLRRIFRIMPVYYVVLFLVIGFAWLRGEYRAMALDTVLVKYLTFMNEWVPPGMMYGHTWTLGVEQKFYLVWPALMFTIGAFTLKRRLPMTLALLALAFVGHFTMPAQLSSAAYYMIIFGCLLALVLHNPKGFALLRPLTHPLAAFPIGIIVVAVQLNIDQIDAALVEGGTKGMIPVALYGLAVALFVVATLSRGPVSWALSTRPMVFLGERSYSIYLIQGLVGWVVALAIPALAIHRTLTGVVVTIGCVLAADLLYRWVEQPMINVGRTLIKKLNARKKARAAAVVEPQQPELATSSA